MPTSKGAKRKVEEEITYIAVTHLTTEALAERLRKMIYDPKGWSKVEKEFTYAEAARRLDHLEVFRAWMHDAVRLMEVEDRTKEAKNNLIEVVVSGLHMVEAHLKDPKKGVEVLEADGKKR